MKKTMIMAMLFVSALLIAATGARGAVLALYDFEDQDVASNDSDALSTAGGLSTAIAGSLTGNLSQNNPGLQISNQHTDRQAAGDSLVFGSPVSGYALVGQYGDIDRNTSLQHAIDNGLYLSFTLTPAPGGQIELELFRISMAITNGTAAKYVGLYSSVNGFASTSQQIGSTLTLNPGVATGQEKTLDLSVLSLDPITSSTEFRIYMVTGASTTSHGFAVDNITMEGSSVIPEPGMIGLLGLFGAALVVRRRLHK